MIKIIKEGLPAETVVTLSTSLKMPLKAIAEITDIAASTLVRRGVKREANSKLNPIACFELRDCEIERLRCLRTRIWPIGGSKHL
jgi:hypothetical protein